MKETSQNNLNSQSLYTLNSTKHTCPLSDDTEGRNSVSTIYDIGQEVEIMEIVDELVANKKNLVEYFGEKRRKKGQIISDYTDIKCFICNSKETRIMLNGRPNWLKYKIDTNGNFKKDGSWDGKTYICNLCYRKETYKLPDNPYNKLKLNAKFRNKQLSKSSTLGKGYIGEQIWCKVRGVKNCNIEMNTFNYKYDHSPDPEYGIVNTKYAVFNNKYNRWVFDTADNCDNFCCISMNKEETDVNRVYIIPKEEAEKRTGITMSINSKDSWYEKYRVDETPYNEAYHSMNLKDCPVLKDESENSDNKNRSEIHVPKKEIKEEEPKEGFKKRIFKIMKR